VTARFVPPTPNCGHVDQVTFTHDIHRDLFMCVLCLASIGQLFPPHCARCGLLPIPGTQLIASFCSTCQRDRRAARHS